MTRYDEVIPDFVPLSISSIERIKDCICWLSPEGKLLYANPQGMEALGYGAEEWRKLTIYEHPRDVGPAFRAAARDGFVHLRDRPGFPPGKRGGQGAPAQLH
jgi:PAS domain-containing protein